LRYIIANTKNLKINSHVPNIGGHSDTVRLDYGSSALINLPNYLARRSLICALVMWGGKISENFR